MAAEPLNVRGPCSSCGAQLASDQRYCVECGHRVGPPLALPYLLPPPSGAPSPGAAPAAPSDGGRLANLPAPFQMVSAFAALALGFGAVIGTAISPNLNRLIAAPGPSFIAEAPPTSEAPAAPTGGGAGGGGGAAAPAAVASSAPTESGGNGGEGGQQPTKKKHRKKQQQAPTTFTGTVVHLNHVAQSYTISTGSLVAIHADSLPSVGQTVQVPVRQLANGTYAEDGDRNAVGTADSAGFTGTVSYCADLEQPAAPCDGSSQTDHYAYAVSSPGASVLVSAPYPAQGAPPQVGSNVDVTVHVGDPFQPVAPASWLSDQTCTPPYDESAGLPADPGNSPALVQTSANVTGQASGATLEAVLQTVCPGDAPKLVLSADDLRESRRDLAAFAVPTGIDLGRLTPGQAVQVAVGAADDGTMSLQGITSDQGVAGADDPAQGQGTLVGK